MVNLELSNFEGEVQIFPINPMPLTGVGKVFKPQLRWDAATRVLTKALLPLAKKRIDYSVRVGPHGGHGSIATVTIAHVPDDERDAITEEVHRILSPLVLRHEIAFK